MPNPLTGDFDVVAQVATTLVDRVLAAQHQAGMYLHSFTVLLDDRETGVRGECQVQLSPPSVDLSGATSRIGIRYDARARMRRAEASAAVPASVHGEVRASVPVARADSGGDPIVAVDLASADVTFVAAAGSTLTADERIVVEQVVRNFVRTNFDPVNVVVPAATDAGRFPIRAWQFRAVPGPPPALALLLQLREAPAGDPASASRLLLAGGDEIAVAVSSELLTAALLGLIRERFVRLRGRSFTITVRFLGRTIARRTYTLSLDDPTVELRDGSIVVILRGRAAASGAPDFSFRITQAFTLRAEAGGIVLDAAGEPSVDASFLIRGEVEREARAARDEAVREARRHVADMLAGVAELLVGMRVPSPRVFYSAVDITRDGIVARGRVELPPWSAVIATYDTRDHHDGRVELDAFGSWIPGGTVRRYRWVLGSERAIVREVVEEHRFFTEVASIITDSRCVWPPCRWCLEVQGVRDGRDVSRVSCGIVGSGITTLMPPATAPGAFITPIEIADASGAIIAHVDTTRGLASSDRPTASGNLLVYFAASRSDPAIGELRDAVTRHADPARFVAAVVVVPAGGGERPQDRRDDVLAWAEDVQGGWTKRFGVKSAPAAFLTHPRGVIAWEHRGPLDAARLDDAFSKRAAGFAPASRLPRAGVIEGKPAPDFVFEHAPGHQIALRSFRGRHVVLVFWTTWSAPSLAELRRHTRPASQSAGPVVFAINDGEEAAAARKAFDQTQAAARLILDPQRKIAASFGISCWPTTVDVGADGRVQHVHIGPTRGGS